MPNPLLNRLRPPPTIDRELLSSPPEPQRTTILDQYAAAGYKLVEPTMASTGEERQEYQRKKDECAIQAWSARLAEETQELPEKRVRIVVGGDCLLNCTYPTYGQMLKNLLDVVDSLIRRVLIPLRRKHYRMSIIFTTDVELLEKRYANLPS